MRKTLLLHNMAHRYGAGLLSPAYFLLGIGLVPTSTLIPEIGDVQNVAFYECHQSCHVENGRRVCINQCSWRQSPQRTVGASKSSIGPKGSTGPNKPVPPKTGAAHN
jgi:hypothetical protein